MTDLRETYCRCGELVMESPRSTIESMCMECRRIQEGVTWTGDRGLGEWHPTVGYLSPGSGWRQSLPLLAMENFPAPTCTSRDDPASFSVPAPVLALAEYARGASWSVRVQVSQGRFPHGTTGKPGGLKDVIGVRFGANPGTDRQAYAVYAASVGKADWSWTSVMIWGPDLPPYGGCGIAELKAYLEYAARASAAALADWVDDLKSVKVNGEVLRKRRERVRKEIKRMHLDGQAWNDVLAVADGVYAPEEVEKIIKGMKNTDREGMR